MATYDWFYGFMRRNSRLSLRIPEPTSLSRSTSFNKHNLLQFFENLRSLMTKHKFGPESIWNIDETGLNTAHKPRKIVATKGTKQVGKVTSADRGELVTACCGMNALGSYIPPFMIFPRKNWQDRMLNGAPTGADGSTHPSGWMTSENFVKYLTHFKKYAKCSLESPCLIVMDNHDSHISIKSLNFAKNNGIHLLTIPPHTSHKTQPLDRTIFGPLKAHYNRACDDWMVNNAGKPITIYEVSYCLGKAFPLAFTPKNIENGFKATGIFPFNSEIFTEEEYLSSYVTDRALDMNSSETQPDMQQLDITEILIHSGTDSPNAVEMRVTMSPQPSTSKEHFKSPEEIRPFPKAAPRKLAQKGRKKGATKILTDTPEKKKIEEEILERQAKKTKQMHKKIESAVRTLTELSFPPSQPKKSRQNLTKTEKLKRITKAVPSSSSDDEQELPLSPASSYHLSDDEDQYQSSSCESENDSIPSALLETHDWVVVNLISVKNLVHRYVGQIKCINENGYLIRWAKKIDNHKFKWPVKDDISEVAKYQIVKKISAPVIKSNSKRVMCLEFKKSLRKFNVE